MEFDILLWLVNNGMVIREVPVSPMMSSDEDESDEQDDDESDSANDDDNVDTGDNVDGGYNVHGGNKVVQEDAVPVEGEQSHAEVVSTPTPLVSPPIQSPPQSRILEPYITSPRHFSQSFEPIFPSSPSSQHTETQNQTQI